MKKHQPDDKQTMSAQDARQGEIILTTNLRKFIFLLGIGGFVLIAVLGTIWGLAR